MEFDGRTEEEAVEKACSHLEVSASDLDYTVIDEGSGGVFGIGARPVQIRVRTEGEAEAPTDEDAAADTDDVAAAPKKKAKAKAKPKKKATAKKKAATKKAAEPEPEDDGEDDDAPAAKTSATSDPDDTPSRTGPAPEKAAQAGEVAQALVTHMGLDEATVEVRDEHEQIVVAIREAEGATDVAEVFGASRPPAIPSFQFLLNKIVNRFPEDRKHIVVDVPSVPKRGRSSDKSSRAPAPELDPDLDPTLVELARQLAERCQTINRVITVHPMLPADRRALHQTITTIEGVHTVSDGEGLYRRLHIVPDSLRSGRKRRRRRRRRGRDEGGSDGADDGRADDGDDDGGEELQDAQA